MCFILKQLVKHRHLKTSGHAQQQIMSLIKKNWREVLSFLFLFGEAFLSVWYTLLHFHLQQVRCWLFNNIKMPKPMILSKYCGGKTEGNIQLSLNSMNQVSLSKFLLYIVKWRTATSLKPPGLINQVMILPLQLCYQFRNTIVSSQDENPWKGGKKMPRYLLVSSWGGWTHKPFLSTMVE